MAYEVPMYAQVTRPGLSYHDVETGIRVWDKPTLITELSVGLLTRLQNGGLVEVDAEGNRIDPRVRNQRGVPVLPTPVERTTPDFAPEAAIVDTTKPVEDTKDDDGPGLDDLLNAAEEKVTNKANTKAKGK